MRPGRREPRPLLHGGASLTPDFVAATVAKYLRRTGASVTIAPAAETLVIAPVLLAALGARGPATIDLGGSTRLYAQADDGAQLIALQLVVPAGTARQTPVRTVSPR